MQFRTNLEPRQYRYRYPRIWETGTMRKFLSFIGVLTVIFATAASAQERRKDEDACGRDGARLCKAVLNSGDYAILDCLRANRTKLRPVCLKYLQEKGQLN
jgi:hypothetical protein